MTKGTFGKAALYAIPLFLGPFIEKLADYLLNDVWPSCPRLVFCSMLGVTAMCIGLRAYFDGSAERDKPLGDKETTKISTVTTTATEAVTEVPPIKTKTV